MSESGAVSFETILNLMLAESGKKESKLHDSVDESRKTILSKSSTSVAINDSYNNSLLALGSDDPKKEFEDYGMSNNTLNWPLWMALYNDSWVFKRVIDKPSQDMIRCGIDIQGDFDKKEDVLREMKKFRSDFIDLVKWGALFGGSIACVMFDGLDDDDYAKPLNSAKLKACKRIRLYVTDRWYGVSPDYSQVVSDMTNIDYGYPKYYNITLADGHSLRFHHDYILRYNHRTAPQFIKNGMLQGWGYSEGSHILNELMSDGKLQESIQSLVDKASIEVIKMAGMRGLFMGTDPENEDQIRKRLEMVNWGRNFNSLTFLDKDDEYSQNGINGLSGLSDILEQNMWKISAAVEMQGILFGDLKNGFSNDVDCLERYDEVINGRCEDYLRKIYEKFLKIVYIKLGIDEKVEFEFNSLLMKKKDSEKIEALKNFVELSSSLLGDGVITPQQYAKSFQMYTTKGIIDFGLTDDVVNNMDDRIENEMESIDLDNGGLI